MDFAEYQAEAEKTRSIKQGGPQGAVAPLFGLAGETGSVLNAYKKYLRDGVEYSVTKEQLKEELGDILWYVAAIATSYGLDLNEVVVSNLQRTQDRYGTASAERLAELPVFDAEFPETERFPRKLVFEFAEQVTDRGQLRANMLLANVEPNAFPDGPLDRGDGKTQGFALLGPLGDPLTDNSRISDNYRFHDAIHFAFLAVLNWSPNTRSLLHLKRKSDPTTDECEDGARAIFAEEGLAAVLSRMAPRRSGFLRETSVDNEVIEIAKAATTELESEQLPGWLWRRAISQGFNAMQQLGSNGGGFLLADLDERHLVYSKLSPM